MFMLSNTLNPYGVFVISLGKITLVTIAAITLYLFAEDKIKTARQAFGSRAWNGTATRLKRLEDRVYTKVAKDPNDGMGPEMPQTAREDSLWLK